MRTQPNIIVTGTPGVGKTTHCQTLAQNTGLTHLSINEIVKERGCHDGFDKEFQSWIVDEDKVSPLGLEKGKGDIREGTLSWEYFRQVSGCKADFDLVVIGFDRRRGQARWIHNRLACLRFVPQELDRLGGCAEGGFDVTL